MMLEGSDKEVKDQDRSICPQKELLKETDGASGID